ncbi:hypothetical protein F8154_12770 [Alkaliphilus pronyensis]|uniref:Uncharacterized protein n=1 Tax=Alkaliphilus pronyensis TaxID=1482732 RepID=A0A6I0F2F0_9FIRM|nr:hypothetical protein [Alkaliphilus pronyensis]KAB3531657.1 hypothetical protein F8154_12770 [Alkaliphilus pronyensis]
MVVIGLANPLTRVIMNNIASKSLKKSNNYSDPQQTSNLKEQEERLLIDLMYKGKKAEGFRDKGPSVSKSYSTKHTSLSELAAKSGKVIEEREDYKKANNNNPPEKKEAYVKKHVNTGTFIDLKSLNFLGNKGSSK